jgi:hypothetical protein
MKKLFYILLLFSFFGKAQLGTGIVAYYKCDESNGTMLTDATGRGHTGTLAGTSTPTFTIGKINNGISFGGGTNGATSSYVDIPTSSDWTVGTGDFSINFWVYENNTSNNITFFDFGYDQNAGLLLEYSTSAKQINLYIGNTLIAMANYTMTVNTWYMVTLCRVSGTGYLYMNASLAKTYFSLTHNITNSGQNISFGRYKTGGENVNGRMDEILVNKTHGYTSSEVSLLWNSSSGKPYPFSFANFFFWF